MAGISIVLIAVAAGSYWVGRRSTGSVATPAANSAPAAPPADPARLIFTGTVRAADPVNVFPDTSGVLQSLHVRKGDAVKEGDLLAIVRNDAFDAIEQRLAQEHQALTARVESLEKSLAQVRIDLARARSEAETARSRIEGARIEAERQKALFQAGATSRLAYEKAQNDWESVRRQSEAVDQILAAAETRVIVEERNAASGKLELEDKRAEWESARGDVQLGEVLATVEGVVVEVQTEAGAAVSPNAEPLLVIAPTESTKFAVVQPTEEQMRRIRVGQTAVLRPQTVSEVREIPGAVSAFRGAEVLIEFEDFEGKLPPGSSIQVEIDTSGGAVARWRGWPGRAKRLSSPGCAWWELRRHEFRLYVSRLVADEMSARDSIAARERLKAIRGIPLLDITPDVTTLAFGIPATGRIPPKAATDAAHIAIAA